MQGNGCKRYRIDISLASLQISEITSYLLGSTVMAWKLLPFDGLKFRVLQDFLINQIFYKS